MITTQWRSGGLVRSLSTPIPTHAGELAAAQKQFPADEDGNPSPERLARSIEKVELLERENDGLRAQLGGLEKSLAAANEELTRLRAAAPAPAAPPAG